MAGLLFRMGKRLLISKRRQRVRGTVIFLITHLLLIMGIVFAVELGMILLGSRDIYLPVTGWVMRLLRQTGDF